MVFCFVVDGSELFEENGVMGETVFPPGPESLSVFSLSDDSELDKLRLYLNEAHKYDIEHIKKEVEINNEDKRKRPDDDEGITAVKKTKMEFVDLTDDPTKNVHGTDIDNILVEFDTSLDSDDRIAQEVKENLGNEAKDKDLDEEMKSESASGSDDSEMSISKKDASKSKNNKDKNKDMSGESKPKQSSKVDKAVSSPKGKNKTDKSESKQSKPVNGTKDKSKPEKKSEKAKSTSDSDDSEISISKKDASKSKNNKDKNKDKTEKSKSKQLSKPSKHAKDNTSKSKKNTDKKRKKKFVAKIKSDSSSYTIDSLSSSTSSSSSSNSSSTEFFTSSTSDSSSSTSTSSIQTVVKEKPKKKKTKKVRRKKIKKPGTKKQKGYSLDKKKVKSNGDNKESVKKVDVESLSSEEIKNYESDYNKPVKVVPKATAKKEKKKESEQEQKYLEKRLKEKVKFQGKRVELSVEDSEEEIEEVGNDEALKAELEEQITMHSNTKQKLNSAKLKLSQYEYQLRSLYISAERVCKDLETIYRQMKIPNLPHETHLILDKQAQLKRQQYEDIKQSHMKFSEEKGKMASIVQRLEAQYDPRFEKISMDTTKLAELMQEGNVKLKRAKQPEGFVDGITLFDYQKQGLYWMSRQERKRAKGGILGDQMGLGKTM